MFRFDFRNKSLSRILVLALACMLVVTSLPAGAFRAFADDSEIQAETATISDVSEQGDIQDVVADPEGNESKTPVAENTGEGQSEEADGMIDTALRLVNIDPEKAAGSADGTGEEGAATVEVKAVEQVAESADVDEAEADGSGDPANNEEQMRAADDQLESVDLKVKKEWDKNGLDVRIPASLTVHLIKTTVSGNETSNKIVNTFTLNESNSWTATATVEAPDDATSYHWTEDYEAGWFLTKIVTNDNVTTLTNQPSEKYDPRDAYTGTKSWNGATDILPDSLTVTLKWSYVDDAGSHAGTVMADRNGLPVLEGGVKNYEPAWTDTDTTEWSYTFGNLPVFSSTGAHIVYTAEESPSSVWESSDPVVTPTSYDIKYEGFEPKKEPRCNTFSFDIETQTDLIFFYVLKGHEELIWTPRPLLQTEKEALRTTLGTHNEVSGITWVYGVPYDYTTSGSGHSGKNISFGIIGGKAHIMFPEHCDWSMFYYGAIGLKEAYTPGSTDFTNTIKSTSITVTKEWDDAGYENVRPESVTVDLKAGTGTEAPVVRTIVIKENGAEVPGSEEARKKSDTAVKAAAEPGPWTYTFSNLPKYDKDGNEITYTVTEREIDSYNSEVTGSAENGYKITNTYVPGTEPPTPPVQTIDIPVTKVWNGDEHHLKERPANITVNLKADGEVVDTVILSANGGEEPGVARKAGDIVLKALRLEKEGEAEEDAWTYTFTGMPKYDEDSNEIEYTVEELKLEKYVSVVTGNAEQGFKITNKFKRTDVYVMKVWDDNGNETELRPEGITVKLLADGKEVRTVDVVPRKPIDNGDIVKAPRRVNETKAAADTIYALVAENGDWRFAFEDLARFNEDGSEIEYTVEEIVPEHYTATITQKEGVVGGESYAYWEIKNECTLTNVYVMKVWNDEDAPEDFVRPETITVTLLANNVEVQTVEVVPRTPEDDGPAVRAPRRASEAKAAADPIKAFVVDGTWRFAFEAVPKYDAEGNKITYTVRETVPANYNATYRTQTETFGDQTITYWEITNTYLAPGMIPIEITKIWDDFNDEDESRPEKVTIFLKANGESYRMIELTKDGILLPDEKETARTEAVRGVIGNSWTCTVIVPELDENGKEITYTVQEVPVADYDEPVITGNAKDGFTVTNRHVPLTDVKVMKVWDDNDDEKELRPETITVTLLANNKEVRTIEVVPIERDPIPADDQPVLRAVKAEEEDEEQGRQIPAMVVEGAWRFGFYDVPKYDEEGNEITYTVRETVPANYSATYTEKELVIGNETITYWEILNKYTETPPYNPPGPHVTPDPPVNPPEETTEIEDPDTPLAPVEEETDPQVDDDTPNAGYEEVPEEEISEEATPLSPFTGDTRHTAVWGAVSVLALLGIVLVVRRRKEE